MEIRNNFTSIEQIQSQYLNNKKTSVNENVGKSTSFAEILEQKSVNDSVAETLKFSKHADERLQNRNINLTLEQIERLTEGTKRANEKGINESLLLMDNLAFIVSTKNNTVITAMDSTNTNEKIFTNIDGAVIV